MIATSNGLPKQVARSDGGGESQRVDHATPAENLKIAQLLDEIARLLADQGASDFRIRAYHKAAAMLRGMPQSVRDVLNHLGIRGLVSLPTIGRSIAHLIEQYLHHKRVPLLDRLRGEETAERLFATLPTIGPELAHRIHTQLGIETLPELMESVEDGRLESVGGIGRKRLRVIGECLSSRLRTDSLEANPSPGLDKPVDSVPVSELLDIDAEYRRLAAAGKLPKIAPKRFNPTCSAWLPILHTHRGDRHYTVLFSNTARAHQLNTTRDWVVIYRDDPGDHGLWTVITSRRGRLRGWRIVCGRERECVDHYIHQT